MSDVGRTGKALLSGYFGLLALFLYAPLVVLLVFAFNSGNIPTLPISSFSTKWFSRAFAGARRLSASRKWAYFLASPLVPFLLLGRMAQRVVRQRCRLEKFAQTLPLLLPVLIVYVAGEFVGYAAGPGDALLKVE